MESLDIGTGRNMPRTSAEVVKPRLSVVYVLVRVTWRRSLKEVLSYIDMGDLGAIPFVLR